MAPSPLEDEHAPLFTVGQVADMLAVKQAFLRRVDELRVVSPQRSAGGQRRYTRYEVRVIQQVVSMADEGITLQAIRRIIDLEQQLAEVTRQRDEVTRQRDELARLLTERPLPGPRSSRSGLGQLLQDRQRGG
jgi:DNA-binding transcriptional MerR regulator